ncbi:ComEC/Rec2 family competence protein [Martelella limonii]|uniref:ComEC/Rec2 family competence protein n=1 Tax=Martelella limonii TaxID=1647649 RepID=UPI00158106B1|nr:ComEC/Rec2 family competence protein [Martelella limonii]
MQWREAGTDETRKAPSREGRALRSPFGVQKRTRLSLSKPRAFRAGKDGSGRPSLAALWREEQEFGRLFLLAPVALSAGVLWWFSLAATPLWWGLALYWGAAMAAALVFRHARPLLKLASAGAALFLSGAGLAAIETARLDTIMLDSPVTTHIQGQVAAREPTASGWRYVVRLTATDDPVIRRPPARATLVARGNLPPVAIGHEISGLARLQTPSAPVLPGLVDFGFLSYFDGVGAVGFFYGPPEDRGKIAAPGRFAAARLAIERMRDAIAGRIRGVLSGDTGAFANAIITGERRALSDEMLTALRNAGLAHIIAISGLHMALAAGIFFSSLRLVLAASPRAAEALPTKKVAALFAVGAALFYLLISGMQVSAERAFIMLAVMLLAAVFDRSAISLRNVALAALIILIATPSEVAGPGMQMSFAATLALMAGYGAWQRRPVAAGPSRFKALRWLWIAASGIAITALIGGVSTTPFAVHHFSRIAGYGLIGNLLAMPIVTLVVMPSGLLALLAMPLNLHAPFLTVMGWGLEWVMAAAMLVDGLGGAVTTGAVRQGFLLSFICGFLPLVLLRTRLRLLGLIPIGVSLVMLAWPRSPQPSQILVDSDGALVALILGESAALNTARPPSFVYEQWETALKLSSSFSPEQQPALELVEEDRFARLGSEDLARADRMLRQTIADAHEITNRFHCVKDAWCYAEYHGIRIVTVERPALAGLGCDHADIVVSRYRPGFQTCRSGAFLVTPAMRRQHGAFRFTLIAPLPMTSQAGLPFSEEPGAAEQRIAVAPARTMPATGPSPNISGRENTSGGNAAATVEIEGEKPGTPKGQTPTFEQSPSHPSAPPQSDEPRPAPPQSAPSPEGRESRACLPITLSVETSVEAPERAWNRHRLYDWRSDTYLPLISLPAELTFSDSGGSARPACPGP